MSDIRISRKILIIAGIVGLALLAFALRIIFVPFESVDFVWFLQHWHSTLASQGFAAFGEPFANYNFPYLYLLYIISLFGLPDIIAVKIVSIIFDIVLCFSVWLVVRHYRPTGYLPYVAALVIAWLPTIFLNSSLWGQCDAIYTSLLVFSFYFILKNKHALSWLTWGIALSFKLQAIFFLPVLVYVWFFTTKKQKWHVPFVAAIPVIAAPIPAILAGRPPMSAYGVYLDQAGTYEQLTMNAANWYQWIPSAHFGLFNKAGLILSLAALGATLLVLIIRRSGKLLPSKDHHLALIASFFLLLAPFVLPQMHERYFYAAGVFLMITAFLNSRYIVVVIATELISLFSYLPFLFNRQSPIPLDLLAIVNLCIILFIFRDLFATPNKLEVTHQKRLSS